MIRRKPCVCARSRGVKKYNYYYIYVKKQSKKKSCVGKKLRLCKSRKSPTTFQPDGETPMADVTSAADATACRGNLAPGTEQDRYRVQRRQVWPRELNESSLEELREPERDSSVGQVPQDRGPRAKKECLSPLVMVTPTQARQSGQYIVKEGARW